MPSYNPSYRIVGDSRCKNHTEGYPPAWHSDKIKKSSRALECVNAKAQCAKIIKGRKMEINTKGNVNKPRIKHQVKNYLVLNIIFCQTIVNYVEGSSSDRQQNYP